MKKILMLFSFIFVVGFIVGCDPNKYNIEIENNVIDYLDETFLEENRISNVNYYNELEDEYYQVENAPIDLTYIINNDQDFDSKFKNYPNEIDFKEKMVLLYFFRETNLRDYVFKSTSVSDNVLTINLRLVSTNKKDTMEPFQRSIMIIMDNEDFDDVKINTNNFKKEKYQLIINDPHKFIINKPKLSYYYDELVLIETAVLMDVSLHLYINDVFHSSQTVIERKSGYVWEYSFKMPKEDTVISFKTVEGFLAIYQLDTITFAPDDYGYDNVIKYNDNLDDYYDILINKYNVDSDSYYIENAEMYKEIYHLLSGNEYERDDLSNYKWYVISRTAAGSQFIKINYYYDNLISFHYPNENEPGDTAMFGCIDIIKIPIEIFDEFRLSYENGI